MSKAIKAGIRTLGTAGVLATALALGGCGGGGENASDLPLIKVGISIKSVSQGGVCETVPVRVSPKQLSGLANKYANTKMIVTEVEMTGPTDENGAPMCNGSKETLPLAPGVWEFRAPLPSDMATCDFTVTNEGPWQVSFVDGTPGCGGATPAAEAAPAEGEAAPAEGDAMAPAEGEAAPAEGAPAP